MNPSEVLDMDNSMFDWNDDLDFGAFLNLPPDDDQGGEEGTHPGTNNELPAIGYGAENLNRDAANVNGYLRPSFAPTLKMMGSGANVLGNIEEARSIAPTQEPSKSSAPDLTIDSSPQKACSCISCLELCTNIDNAWSSERRGHICRFPSCHASFDVDAQKFYEHEKSHYGQPGKYTCLEEKCQVVTKNFGDLKRHDKAKHCTNPDKEQFPCPMPWCKYSGSNGFARKDKLRSHYKNIHEGKPGPVKIGRVIKLATLKPEVSGLEGSAGKQKK